MSFGAMLVSRTEKRTVYPSHRLGILKALCRDVILGQDFQKEHKSVIIEYGGSKPELTVAKSARQIGHAMQISNQYHYSFL